MTQDYTRSTKSFQCFANTGPTLEAPLVDMVNITKFVGLGDASASLNN